MVNQFENVKKEKNKREYIKELHSLSVATLIINSEWAINFLLEVRKFFFPDRALYAWGNLEFFLAEELNASDLNTYGLEADAIGWYYVTPCQTVYPMDDDAIQDLAHLLLLEIDASETPLKGSVTFKD